MAEACSGLRMMMMFFAMCVGAAFVVEKPLWEKLFIIASAVPIAVLANVARIVVTAVCFARLPGNCPSLMDPDQGAGRSFIHGRATSWMPVGLLLLWMELTLLSKLLIAPLPERPLVMGNVGGERAPAAMRPAEPRATKTRLKRARSGRRTPARRGRASRRRNITNEDEAWQTTIYRCRTTIRFTVGGTAPGQRGGQSNGEWNGVPLPAASAEPADRT